MGGGAPRPQVVPPNRARGLCNRNDAPGPRDGDGGGLSRRRAVGAAGPTREPRGRLGARHPPPRPPRGPAAPARPSGGRAGRETAPGASSAPASCADPSGVLRPRGQWREGKKGLRNLAEALNGVGRRGEGLGRGRRRRREERGCGRRERGARVSRAGIAAEPRTREAAAAARSGDDTAHARPWPRVRRCARRKELAGGGRARAPPRSQPDGARARSRGGSGIVWIVSYFRTLFSGPIILTFERNTSRRLKEEQGI